MSAHLENDKIGLIQTLVGNKFYSSLDSDELDLVRFIESDLFEVSNSSNLTISIDCNSRQGINILLADCKTYEREAVLTNIKKLFSHSLKSPSLGEVNDEGGVFSYNVKIKSLSIRLGVIY